MSKDDSTGKIQWDRLIKKLSPYTVQKGLRYLKHYGLKEFWIRLHERFEPEEVPYGPWYEAYRPDEETLEKQRKRKFPDGPLISIVVPAYLTPERFLRQMLDSLLAQTYENWELCLANGSPEDPDMQTVLRSYAEMDRRIRYQDLKENLGIAENTNAAFAMAEGDFIALLDHDDLLAPNALYEIAAALEEHPEADVIYTDEDKVTTDLSEHFQPHLKPDFNLDLLRSNNYICHFLVVRRSVVQTVGGFRREFDGAVWSRPGKWSMYRRSFITGGPINPPQQIIRQARCMLLKPADVPLRGISNGPELREPWSILRILDFTV